jgi:hypothetical protein
MKRLSLCVAALACLLAAGGADAALPTMVKHVTDQATFALYLPEGWRASEREQGGQRTLIVSDPDGLYGVTVTLGRRPGEGDLTALAKAFVAAIARQCPGFQVASTMISRDKSRLVFDGTYGAKPSARREFRAWITLQGQQFVYSSIGAPGGKLTGHKSLLLTILANVRVLKTGLLARRPGTDTRTIQGLRGAATGGSEFIDPARTALLQGQQAWLVAAEGARLERADAWGARDRVETARGAAPIDSVRLGGQVRYGQEMVPLDRRALWQPGGEPGR